MPFDEDDTDKKLNAFVEHIGNRYFIELYGTTPNRILAGDRIDKYRFKQQIQQAKLARVIINQEFTCSTMPT